MIKLNKKIEYALIALLHLAQTEKNVPVKAREIAELYNIPPELLGKVMQKLVKNGFIASVQGINGGYILTRPLHELDMFTIIDKIDGPAGITSCTIHDGTSCSCKQLDVCNIKHAIDELQEEINGFFRNITLDRFITTEKTAVSV